LVEAGETGEIYNIGADAQLANVDLTRTILERMGLGEDRIEYVTDRPGHDRRYAVDSGKLRALGWAPSHGFDEHISDTIDWYRSREDWWGPLVGEGQ
jgi:dTDP-glucose 4,6-dehydratase